MSGGETPPEPRLFGFFDGEGAPASGEEGESSPQEKQLAQSVRRQARILAGLALFTLAVALFGILLNLIGLSKATPPPMSLVVLGPVQATGQLVSPILVWSRSPSEGEGLRRPRVLLDRSELQPGEAGRSLPIGSEAPLQILVDSEVDLGVHLGELQFRRQGESPSATEAVSIPIRIEVFGGVFSRSWLIARWWLGGTAVLLGALYALCVLIVPRPRGSLVLSDELSGRPSVRVGLRPTAMGYLFPWNRAWIPLEVVARWGGQPGLKPLRGGLFFLASHLVRLETRLRTQGRVLEKAPAKGNGTDVARGTRFRPALETSLMAESQVFRIRSFDSERGIRLRYQASVRGPSS